jgi:polyisoprenyl-phosphate glycosyltransferase
MKQNALVSVVIPAYNEASGISWTVKNIQDVLNSFDIFYEIIIVDDGSTDETFLTIKALSENDARIRGIKFSRNFGKESALLAGLSASSGAAVITIDADLQHPPKLIPDMLEKWRNGYRIVHAVKRSRTNDSILKRICAKTFNSILSALGGINVNNSSDFKLLDREIVNAVVNQLPERRRFYRGLTNWVGFEKTEIQFDVSKREEGYSKWSLLSLIDLALTGTVSFTNAPMRIVTFLGFITLLIAIIIGSETLWSKFKGTSISGFATLEITILLTSSFIMISLGIIGEYLAKMYDEIKARPHYLVLKTCGFTEGKNAQGQIYPLSKET